MASFRDLQKDFENLIQSDHLAHGYIFFGREGGKLQFAKQLAGYLETNSWDITAPLLDSSVIGNGIDEIREGIRFLWQKPLRSRKKTLIISEADNLTPEAQNAVLKIAEDPPAHGLIMLLVKNPDTLLPTVRSRFQKIYLSDLIEVVLEDENLAKDFLRSDIAKRKEIIKDIVEDDQKIEVFITALIKELRRDKIKNWTILKDLLNRWTIINNFNTNKRLQLESALLWIKPSL